MTPKTTSDTTAMTVATSRPRRLRNGRKASSLTTTSNPVLVCGGRLRAGRPRCR